MTTRSQSAKRDFLIPVLGATGAGKSFFINALLGRQEMAVGRGLDSCTRELGFGYIETIEGYPSLKDYRIVLVDTPGFDDTHQNDLTVLEKIANWLKDSHKSGAKLGGVIYLHDITTCRLDGPARRRLLMFRSLCGEDIIDKVVLGTTKWVLNVPDSELCHNQLVNEYWRPLSDKGAQVRRFDNTYDSAWSLIDAIISAPSMPNQTYLQIQKEMADPKITTLHTSAGQYVTPDIPPKISIKARAFRPFVGLFRKSRAVW